MRRKKFMVLSFFLFFLLASKGFAVPYNEQSTGAKIGLAFASIMTTIPYFPLKLAFASVGGVASGLSLVLTAGKAGDSAANIAKMTAGGDWYIHPNVFTGDEQLNFIGPDDK